MQKDSAKVLIDVMMAQFFDANLLCGQLEVVHGLIEGAQMLRTNSTDLTEGPNGPNGRSTPPFTYPLLSTHSHNSLIALKSLLSSHNTPV